MQRIPKVVHSCWFGGKPKPPLVEWCQETQRRVLKDYEFVEWSEANFDLDRYPFLRKAYEDRQFAHLSDMIRLLALRDRGGIYFDTDVEVRRPFDDLLEADFLVGYMWKCMLGTAIFASVADHPILHALLRPYLETPEQIDYTLPNNHIFTRYFIDQVEGFRLDGREWRGGGVRVMDMYAFEQPSFTRRSNYAIHHFTASWRGQSAMKRRLKAAIIRVFGLYAYRRYINEKAFRTSAFRPVYEKAVAERR